jgi:hypothetical protein
MRNVPEAPTPDRLCCTALPSRVKETPVKRPILAVSTLLFFAALVSMPGKSASQASKMRGYAASRVALQQGLEELFLSLPSPDRMKVEHRFLTAEPHPA